MSAYSSLKDLIDGIRDLRTRATTSLTEFSKVTNINHRAYIQESLQSEEIMIPLISTLHQMDIAFVLCAIGLNEITLGGRTVRNLMEFVSTEAFQSAAEVVDMNFGANDLDREIIALEASVMDTELASNRFGAGKLVEIDVVIGSDDKGALKTVKAHLLVQILPTIIPTDTVNGFLNLNFTPTLSQRWTQARAGEIKFVKDLIFSADLVKQHKKALQSDQSGVLKEMLKRQEKGFRDTIISWTGLLPENHNTANTILIADANTFEMAAHEAGIRFDRYNDRQRFFGKSFAMMVVCVNPDYKRVKIYLNGIDSVGDYSFDMINKLGKNTRDSLDVKDIMNMFAQGAMPRI
jgi:hypothetical protein